MTEVRFGMTKVGFGMAGRAIASKSSLCSVEMEITSPSACQSERPRCHPEPLSLSFQTPPPRHSERSEESKVSATNTPDIASILDPSLRSG